MSFHRSSVTIGDGMIRMEHPMNSHAIETNGPGFGFPSSIESVSLQQATTLQDGKKEFPRKWKFSTGAF
ncbi:hypothetical protein AAG906_003238 [Vitis piasezkii]